MKILNIKFYLGGGLGALSPISQIIRILDSAPQLPKIKSLLPGYPSSPKPLLRGEGRLIPETTSLIFELNVERRMVIYIYATCIWRKL